LGFGQRGLSLGQRGLGLGQFGVHGVGGKHGQHLPFFHQVADIHADLGQAQTTDLGADRRFLPGRDVAVGRQAVGDVGARGV
jgi:hypothetical protein